MDGCSLYYVNVSAYGLSLPLPLPLELDIKRGTKRKQEKGARHISALSLCLLDARHWRLREQSTPFSDALCHAAPSISRACCVERSGQGDAGASSGAGF